MNLSKAHIKKRSLVSEGQLDLMSDEEILQLRFKEIDFNIEFSNYADCISQFYRELELKGLRHFKPIIYVGDEWFSPEGMNAIAIPFYLIYSRLIKIEKKYLLEVEGEKKKYFLKLLRHEAGHCFDHCYRFSKNKEWVQIFGSPQLEYQPENYRPQPYSKSYVQNLDRWYAQAHPEEDFAETFAVWLDPESDWKNHYRDWPVALNKLKYVNKIVKESIKLKDKSEKGVLPYSVQMSTLTLEKHYIKRKKEQAQDYPDFFDEDLKLIFSQQIKINSNQIKNHHELADEFLMRYQKEIVNIVSWSTQEKKITVNLLVKKLIDRCKTLNLYTVQSDQITSMKIMSYLTSLIKNYLFTGKFKREV